MKLHQFLFAYYIKMHHKVNIKSQALAQLLHIFYYFQLISLVLDTKEKKDRINTFTNLMNLFYYLNQIFRPYQYLMQFSGFRLYCFLIPLIIEFTLSIDLVYKLIFAIFKKEQDKQLKQTPIKYFLQLLSISFQIHFYVISLASLDLLTNSLFEAWQNLSENIAIFIICIIFLLRQLLFIFINMQCSESIYFQASTVQVEQITKSNFYIYILITIGFYLNSQSTFNEQVALHILNFIIIGFYLFKEMSKQANSVQTIAFIILNLAFLYNISYFVYQNDKLSDYSVIVVYLFFPFCYILVCHFQRSYTRLTIKENRSVRQIYNNLIILYKLKNGTLKNTSDLLLLKFSNSTPQQLFEKELIQFNHTIILEDIDNKIFWYIKYIAIQFALGNYVKTTQLIHHLREKQLYFELNKQYIKVNNQLTYLQQFQIKRLQKESTKYIHQTITKNLETYSFYETNQFIKNKLKLNSIQHQLIDLFTQKLQYYQQILEYKNYQSNELYQICFNISQNSIILLDQLKKEYQKSKSYKLQQLLILFYSQFFNNQFEAEQLKYQLSNNDLKINYLDDMDYLRVQVCSDMINFILLEKSENFFKKIGYKDEQKNYYFQFQQFFPQEFQSIHEMYLQNFFQTGKSKFLNKPQEVILRGYENIYYYSQFQISVLNYNSKGLYLCLFFQLNDEQPKSIFINKENKIIGYTKQFLKLIPLQNDHIQKNLFQMNIFKLIPELLIKQLPSYQTIFFTFTDLKYVIFVQQIMNVIEIQILDNNLMQNQEQDFLLKSVESNKNINIESIVDIPMIFQEDIQSPISAQNFQTRTFQVIQRTETKKMLTYRSINISEKNSEGTQNKNQIQKPEKLKEEINQDITSSKFSRGFLDKALYTQKYIQLIEFLQYKNKFGYNQLSLSFFLLGLIISIILQIINITLFFPQYQTANSDSDILGVKSDFITPIHNCVNAQVAVIDYSLLYEMFNEITYETYIYQSAFALDSVERAYENLKTSYSTQLNNQNLDKFLQNEYINLQQIGNDGLQDRNLTLKNALYYYEEAQYFVTWKNLNDSQQKISSNDHIYLMMNIVTLDDFFDNLSSQILDYLINNLSEFNRSFTIYFAKMVFLELFFILMAISIVIKNQQLLSKQFNIFCTQIKLGVQEEAKQLIETIEDLKDLQFVEPSKFDLTTQENDIKKWQNHFNKSNQQILNAGNYSYKKTEAYAMFIVFFIFYVIPQLVLQQLGNEFYEKYQNTSILLESLSQVSSSVTAIYELRETSYMINQQVPFFQFTNDSQRLIQNEKILQELQKIKSFSSNFSSIDISQLLVSQNFQTLYNNITTSNLCQFLTNFSQELAEMHCKLIYSGVMKLGLLNTLNEIYQQISQEYENTNGFEQSLRGKQAAFEEVEIGIITSDALLFLKTFLSNELINKTSTMQLVQQAFIASYIILSVLFSISLIYCYYPYQIRKAQIIRNLIFLVPKLQFYLDAKFETQFRQIIKQYTLF